VGIVFVVYAPALGGGFVSDDQHYVWGNPYVREATLEHVREILDPDGAVVPLVENYAPVHLLLHSLQWQIFGEDTRGYHVTNVALHGLASALLVLLFVRLGIAPRLALLGGAVFLVHPANVEAVAWISQLKSLVALVLALAAFLAHPSRPLLGLVLFGGSLLAKPAGLVALPALAVLGWVRRDDSTGAGPAGAWRWRWLAGWVAVLAIFALLELRAFAETAGTHPDVYDDPMDRLRSSIVIGGRYLSMAVTSYGLSTFHDPPPVQTWGAPALWVSLAALAVVVWRSATTLLQRRPEAVCWAWAAAGYAPICGILSLPFTLADRYLYFVLPGLIGAALSAAAEFGPRLPLRPRGLALAGVVLASLLLLGGSVRSFERARLWGEEHRVMFDAARNYPEGRAALFHRARSAALTGDVDTMLASLERLSERGFTRLDQLLQDQAYTPYQEHPRFKRLLVEIATWWLERLGADQDPSQSALYLMAVAHQVRGESEEMLQTLEQARRIGGPLDEQIDEELEVLRRRERLRRPRPVP
jgi:hypothetical protein